MDLRSDTAQYVALGVFTILVFVAAITVLVVRTSVSVDSGTLPTLVVGFGLFMGSYFVALLIYTGIQRLEEVQ